MTTLKILPVLKSQMHDNDQDCTRWCKSKHHGGVISATITKRAVSDVEVAAYANRLCANIGEVLDQEGRTPLHLAASCGRSELLQYLIKAHNANIDMCDLESGYTALHRAVFYGQLHIAAILLKMGANSFILDNMGLSPGDHAMKDRLSVLKYTFEKPGDVYVWGSNDNYTLGTGGQHSRTVPDVLETFRKQAIYIKQVSLDKFHTLFLSQTGSVYSCGHGRGGRLGLGSESTVLVPQLIKLSGHGHSQELCVGISAGRDHSLFVMESGVVWSCGLNPYHQLGHEVTLDVLLSPRPLRTKMSSVRNVCATKFHSVAWGPKAVFTWGLHGGQLGHDRNCGKTIAHPRKVPGLNTGEDSTIIAVAASDGATVIATSKGHIYVLHEFQCRKIASKQLNTVSVAVVGGHLSSCLNVNILKDRGGEQLKVLVLTNNGNVLLWQESSLQLTRCIFSLNRPLTISSAFLNQNQVLLTTFDGEAFRGEIKIRKNKKNSLSNDTPTPNQIPKSAFHEFVDRDESEMIKVKRIPNVHRAICITSDSKGINAAVIQADPCCALTAIPEVEETQMANQMLEFFESASENDPLHDVILKVGFHRVPCHKFIIFNSEVFKSLYNECNNVIEIENVVYDIFKYLLIFMYTGTCDMLTPGQCPVSNPVGNSQDNQTINYQTEALDVDKSQSDKKRAKQKKNKSKVNETFEENEENKIGGFDPIRQLREYAKRFGVTDLQAQLEQFRYDNGVIYKKMTSSSKVTSSTVSWNRKSHTDLFDVSLRAEGTSTSPIKAHRCLLAARLEYFNGMFMHMWTENSSKSEVILPYPQNVLELIIDFLYTDSCSKIDMYDDLDFICTVLTVADQLFITRLKQKCEVALSKRLTLKNACLVTQFADVYNAQQLKNCCLQYICLNLPAFFENKTFDILNDNILRDVSKYYCEYNPIMSKRIITPYSTAPSDEEVKAIADSNAVDINECDDGTKKKEKILLKKTKRTRKSSEHEIRKARAESLNENIMLDLHLPKLQEANNERNGEEKKDIVKEISVVQKRLNAISVAEEIVVVENYEKLIPNRFPKTRNDFPDLIVSANRTKLENFKQDNPENIKQGNPENGPKYKNTSKLSQKERKKLAQNVALELETLNKKPVSTSESWSGVKNFSTNGGTFANILKNDDKNISEINLDDNKEDLQSKSAESSGEISTRTENNRVVFSDILADERKQRENYSRMKSKSLILTQIEDRAIEELGKFYGIDQVDDEMITISRVSTEYAAPLWLQPK